MVWWLGIGWFACEKHTLGQTGHTLLGYPDEEVPRNWLALGRGKICPFIQLCLCSAQAGMLVSIKLYL